MTKPSTTAIQPGKIRRAGTGADAPPVRPKQPTKTPVIEDAPIRYASPPCYLAEFSHEDCADQTAN